MTKAILFDLGNVLVGFDFERGYRALASACRCPAEEIPQRIANSGLIQPFERGEISSDEFVRRLSQILGLEVSFDRFSELWASIFLPEPLVPERVLVGLKGRYRMVLLSNTNQIHYEMIRQTYGLIRHFDAYVLSYEVGAMKPSERIYREAVRQSGCEPQECFYIDDIPEFVEAARRLGIDATQFHGATPLEGELRRRGLLTPDF